MKYFRSSILVVGIWSMIFSLNEVGVTHWVLLLVGSTLVGLYDDLVRRQL